MAICRSRRRGGGRPLLPSTISFLPPNYLSLSSSFWYTDFKIYTFNHVLFRLGSAHSRFLKVWFSPGACFGLVAVLILSIMLIWNSWGAVSFKGGAFWLDSFFSPGRSISFLDFALLILSTLISIAFHEFGHAFAAASEGLQIEYIAIFLAVLFPGVLVALNQISLENLCPFASLRIYCASIWHNIVMVEKKEVSSSGMPEYTINSVANDQTEFNNSDDLGDMNSGQYFANMAEGLMMEPPVEELSNLDDKEWGEAVSLWSW